MNNYLVEYSLKEKLWHRYLLHFYLQPFCEKRKQLPESAIHDNFYIFAQHRGGSTWLAEILGQIPKTTTLTEPLWRGRPHTNGKVPDTSIGRCDEIRELELYFQQPIPSDAIWPEAELFFKYLFKGEICKLGLYDDNNIRQLSPTDSFIFKFCFGNQLMVWLTKKLHIRPILLVRHPCAVVQSQMHMLHWEYILKQPEFKIADFKYNEAYKSYSHILDIVKTPEENLAAQWCLNMVSTLSHPSNNSKWLTIAYENLYLEFNVEIGRIFKWINRPIPTGIKELHLKPSQYTKEYSLDHIKSGNQLHLWKERLSTSQIDRILNIVDLFGIKAYTEDIHPNLEIVYGAGNK